MVIRLGVPAALERVLLLLECVKGIPLEVKGLGYNSSPKGIKLRGTHTADERGLSKP